LAARLIAPSRFIPSIGPSHQWELFQFRARKTPAGWSWRLSACRSNFERLVSTFSQQRGGLAEQASSLHQTSAATEERARPVHRVKAVAPTSPKRLTRCRRATIPTPLKSQPTISRPLPGMRTAERPRAGPACVCLVLVLERSDPIPARRRCGAIGRSLAQHGARLSLANAGPALLLEPRHRDVLDVDLEVRRGALADPVVA
jgi:hypothetical protein